MFCRKTRPRFIGGFGVWLTLVLVGWCGSNAVAQLLIQQLLIQEVLYDGPGSDADDVFTEIVGPGGMSLQGWALVGINGENGELYRTVDLSGAAIPADGVLVVATASAAEPLLAQRDWVGSVDWQNGPDAVLLQGPQGEVVDALQYGNADPFNQGEGTPASLVPAGASLGRDALSSDTGDNAVDFGVIEMPTPGQVGADTTGQSGEGAAQGWTVTVPDTVARYGQSLSLPLRLAVDDDGGGGVAIVAAEVFLSFERDIMRLDSVTTEQTAWSLIHHVASGQANTIDTLKTALATGGQGLVGQPTLFMAHFTLVDNRAPAVAPLRLEYLLLNDGQPTATAVHGQVRRVGGSGDVTVLPKQLALPDSILVKVIDADADLDPGVADQVRVRITGSADSEELDLEETAPNSGVFKGGIAARNEMPKNSDGVVQLEHGASAQICYTDDLDATGQTIGRCVTVVQHSGHSGQIAATVVAQLGDTLRVRVADADLNTDPNLQDVVAVQVTATSFSDTLDLVLTEVGVDVGVFFGGVVLDAGGVEGIAVGRGDTVSLNYTDSRDATGQPVERQALTRVVGLFGDVDGNGRVQAFDAAKILEHMLSPVLTGVDSLAANVDSLALQGRVTAFDAALILQYRVGLRQRFPVQEDKAGNHPQMVEAGAAPKVGVKEYALTLRRQAGYLTLWAEQRLGIVSGEIVLEGVGAARLEMAPGLEHFLSAARSEDGVVRLVFAGATPLHSPGPLVRVYAADSIAKARIVRARFNDGRIVGRPPVDTRPSDPVLYANFPNPFNPETTIRFTLESSARVRLTVFNAAGQQMRQLADAAWPAGTHQVQWDGLDQEGMAVSSGVYFYRLYVGAQSRTRGMLLLR